MLIVAGGTRADRFLAQAGIERLPMEIGEFVEQGFRLGTGGENAPDCRQGEGAEADGAFQSLMHIVALILSQERQELLCLQFALDLLGEQAVEELQGHQVLWERSGAVRWSKRDRCSPPSPPPRL